MSKSVLNAHEYVLQIQQHLHQIHAQARGNLKHAGEKQAKQYNNRLKVHNYDVGSKILYYHPNLAKKTKENFLKWQGPYVILDVLSDTLYKVQTEGGSEAIVVHHNKLKPFAEREENSTQIKNENACEVPNDIIENEEGEISSRPQRMRQQPERLGEWVEIFKIYTSSSIMPLLSKYCKSTNFGSYKIWRFSKYSDLASVKFGVSPSMQRTIDVTYVCWRPQILAKIRNSPIRQI